MPAPVKRGGRVRLGSAPAATDTSFLTVMLDVTANLLCAAIILLILSLAMDRRITEPTSEEIAVVTAPILTPAGLVAAFHARAGTAADAVTIDIDKAGVTVKRLHSPPAMAARLSRGDVIAGKLEPMLAEGGQTSVLLFIFDQSGYGAVRAAIDKAGLPSREIDVPLALRSAADPQTWSQGFQSLFGGDLDAQAFQQRLQEILVGQGGAEGAATDLGLAAATDGAREAIGRLLGIVGFWWRLMLVAAALIFMIRLRRRPPSARGQDAAE